MRIGGGKRGKGQWGGEERRGEGRGGEGRGGEGQDTYFEGCDHCFQRSARHLRTSRRDYQGQTWDSLADAFENPPEEERPEGVEGEVEEEGTVEEA